jgi:hypothetical protein
MPSIRSGLLSGDITVARAALPMDYKLERQAKKHGLFKCEDATAGMARIIKRNNLSCNVTKNSLSTFG